MAKQFYWKALQSDKLPPVIVDIFAVPDYSDCLCDLVDPHFGRCFKQRDGIDWTQLQFIIERVPVSSEFPLGVKTTSRYFSLECGTTLHNHIFCFASDNSRKIT